MKTVFFNPNGGTLIAKGIFLGKMVANYEIFLRQRNSNAQTTLITGDNLNPEDDVTGLPDPPVTNDGRRVILETGFFGLDHTAFPEYEIRLEIHQDGMIIGSDSDEGTLTGKGQYSLIFLRLVANP